MTLLPSNDEIISFVLHIAPIVWLRAGLFVMCVGMCIHFFHTWKKSKYYIREFLIMVPGEELGLNRERDWRLLNTFYASGATILISFVGLILTF